VIGRVVGNSTFSQFSPKNRWIFPSFIRQLFLDDDVAGACAHTAMIVAKRIKKEISNFFMNLLSLA
jgi:hypothetical protein